MSSSVFAGYVNKLPYYNTYFAKKPSSAALIWFVIERQQPSFPTWDWSLTTSTPPFGLALGMLLVSAWWGGISSIYYFFNNMYGWCPVYWFQFCWEKTDLRNVLVFLVSLINEWNLSISILTNTIISFLYIVFYGLTPVFWTKEKLKRLASWKIIWRNFCSREQIPILV